MTLHSFHIGGCELQLLSLSKSLQEHGIEVIILHSLADHGYFPTSDTLRFFYIPPLFFKFRLIPLYLSYLFRWKLKRFPSLFHCHSISYFTEQILWFAQKHHIPTLVKATTEGHIDELKSRIDSRPNILTFFRHLFSDIPLAQKRQYLENLLFGKNRLSTFCNVTGYLSINPHISEELRRFPIAPQKIHSLLNAVDPNRFHPVTEAEKSALKQALGLPPLRMITAMSRFVPRKRIEDLIIAWSALAPHYPSHLLLIVGDGPSLNTYQKLISTHDLERRVVLLPMQKRPEDIYKLTDLFILPSEREGLPNALLEAMSTQLPIIATTIGGVQETLSHQHDALLVAPRDVSALTQALSHLLDHPDQAEQLARNAREKILRSYSFAKTTPRFISLYRTLATANS